MHKLPDLGNNAFVKTIICILRSNLSIGINNSEGGTVSILFVLHEEELSAVNDKLIHCDPASLSILYQHALCIYVVS